jgi:DsbC/DsbD-like thiol-disulfide interchange protein
MKRAPGIAVSIVSTACCLIFSEFSSGAGGVAMAQVSVPGTFSRPAGGPPVKSGAWPQSPWVKGHNSAVRLIGGAEPAANGRRRLVVGVELTLGDGWKTYWRHPGDDGGLPPTFIWDQSRNLASARVMYPAPERIKSLNGTTIGYSKAVIFPVEIEAQDASRPVEVSLSIEYGICREICVPAEARIALVLESKLSAMPPDLAGSLARVPATVSGAAVQQVLKSAKATLTGAQPVLTFEIVAGSAGEKRDLFVEPMAGEFLPVPAKSGDVAGGVQRFRIDLKGVDDASKLAGKPLRLTVTGAGGGSEIEWVVK